MLHWLPGPINGLFSLGWLAANTLLCTTPLFLLAFFKWVIPHKRWRAFCDHILNGIAQTWVAINNAGLALTKRIRWNVTGLENLQRRGWYMVLANHQSWTDIVVLQKVFHRRIPFLKFFIKKELIYVPVLGLAWWAMDFPFMKRTPKSVLKKKPHLKGRDLQETIKACEKFKAIPISVMNFAEGTRATLAKIKAQKSPYRHLLRPKAAGTAIVLAALGQKLNSILDVTIVYPEGTPSFWAFISGKMQEIRVHVESIPVRADLVGDYFNDPQFRIRFQRWLNKVWEEKDRRIQEILEEYGAVLDAPPNDAMDLSAA
ncbi:1-acyl-sn-glycerol-3-phosphate acyltransferases [Desulfacinum hydrothermale DSM 13146]|uniref:1-acyl-sn-glycerol-3-phosphate acyltransferases n=1 Tax=Desulfacinum hydrothermale DSM 13146 TaxID=1121390 RepID=A0A1W1WXS6_9BACT|nr:acyltransferase [Desulfacinum hydrothermale]SMC16228.1 1-acyl-sn-glycerol-3-phosphate acyltransferases [Desulfacinum hydrothermale DSM 13146]